MTKFYIVGGEQRRRGEWGEEWHRYGKCVVARLDSETGAIELVNEYVSPAEACPADENPAILYKAGTVEGDTLYVCTQTEVMGYSLPDFQRTFYVSLPCFNDVHHVCPTARGTLLVVSTGLDLVVEVSTEGEVVREWSTVDGDPWDRFSRDIDYRHVLTTKPHESHPNYVFELDGEPWVTRFEFRDAMRLADGERFGIGKESPHDGVQLGGLLYFTTVDGHVCIFDGGSRELIRTVDLSRYYDLGPNGVLGWCRGIEPLDSRHVVVGFSAVRETSIHRNLRWMKSRVTGGAMREPMPCRVALFDIEGDRLVWEYETAISGVDAIFSIHAIPDS